MARKLAIIHIVLGGIATVFLLFLVGMSARAIFDGVDGGWLVLFFTLAAGMLPLASLIGGIGLFRGAEWGRITIVAVSILILLGFPFGTILGAFGLWVFFKNPPHPLAPYPDGSRSGSPSSSA